jgi:hypothetical protein
MATLALVAVLECRQLRVAIRADHPQVVAAVVRRVAIDVIEDEDQGSPHPLGCVLTSSAPVLLGVQQVEPDVVQWIGTDAPLTGQQPPRGVRAALMCALTLIAAVDLFPALGQHRFASETCPHVVTLWIATDIDSSR